MMDKEGGAPNSERPTRIENRHIFHNRRNPYPSVGVLFALVVIAAAGGDSGALSTTTDPNEAERDHAAAINATDVKLPDGHLPIGVLERSLHFSAPVEHFGGNVDFDAILSLTVHLLRHHAVGLGAREITAAQHDRAVVRVLNTNGIRATATQLPHHHPALLLRAVGWPDKWV